MANCEPMDFEKVQREFDEWLSRPYPSYGGVVWDKKTNQIELHKSNGGIYYIDLDRCKTKAELLNWIFHIMGKNWAEEIIYDLLKMFKSILPAELMFNWEQ